MIHYEEIIENTIQLDQRKQLFIGDPNITETIVNELKSNTRYQLHIAATTAVGEGER